MRGKKKLTFWRRSLRRGDDDRQQGRRVFQCASVFLSSTPNPVQSHSLFQHAHSETLLEATRLTRFSAPLVDLAIAGRRALVLDVACETRSQESRSRGQGLTLNRAFEEGFAGFARRDSIVETGSRVPADQAQSFGRVVHVLTLDAVDAVTAIAGHCAVDFKLRNQIKIAILGTDLEQNISCCVTDSAGVRGDEAGVTSMLEGLVYRSCVKDYYYCEKKTTGGYFTMAW